MEAETIKTPMITYNVHDRGRKVLGQDRRFDLPKLKELINGPAVQERVKQGDMLGYFGHWPRLKFGMATREGGLLDGQAVSLPIAVRTIHLSCDDQGNITHQAEFMNTEAGREAAALYASKAGGFSSAIIPKKGTFPYEPKSFEGMDFVLEPNYAGNRGYRAILDSILLDSIIPDEEMEAEMAELLDQAAEASAQEIARLTGLLDAANTALAAANEKAGLLDSVQAELTTVKADLATANAKAEAAAADLAAANEKVVLLDSVTKERDEARTALEAATATTALLDSTKAELVAAQESVAVLDAVRTQLAETTATLERTATENDLLVSRLAAATSKTADELLDSVRHESAVAPGRGGKSVEDFRRFKDKPLAEIDKGKSKGGDGPNGFGSDAEGFYKAKRLA